MVAIAAGARRGRRSPAIGSAFCLDTAHAWGAGHRRLADPAAIDDLLAGFDDGSASTGCVLVHLNDSRAELGSRLDRHEHLGAGRIGADGHAATSLRASARSPTSTYILETPGMDEGYDAINLARARALARGERARAAAAGGVRLDSRGQPVDGAG